MRPESRRIGREKRMTIMVANRETKQKTMKETTVDANILFPKKFAQRLQQNPKEGFLAELTEIK